MGKGVEVLLETLNKVSIKNETRNNFNSKHNVD